MKQAQNRYENMRNDVRSVLETTEKVMYGMSHVTKLIIISMICNDHILLEDVPGTGKTKLTKTIAKILDLKFRRIQGTPDLLPGDLTGVNIFDQKENSFKFVPGPIFTNILLFDEINRASPKTQSALLEAMEERQVSVDNNTYKIEKPFFVIATQNPVEFIGTYPLPQAQLDRFLIKTRIGYPSVEVERKILTIEEEELDEIQLPKLSKNLIFTWQGEYKKVFIKDEVVEKLINVINQSRDKSKFVLGISPRSGRKLVRALKASAYIYGRDFVSRDDIYDLFIPIMHHRVYGVNKGEEDILLKQMIQAVGL